MKIMLYTGILEVYVKLIYVSHDALHISCNSKIRCIEKVFICSKINKNGSIFNEGI